MPTGCRRVCAVASTGGDEAAEMASGCHLIRAGENPACIDGAGSTNDEDTSGGYEGHLTNPIRHQNRTMNPQKMRPDPMNCPKTTTRPLTLPGQNQARRVLGSKK
jgi:hypothetical protein